MLTSKELMQRAGISRATLNNYIAQGILPKPEVKRPGARDERAPRLGYFPDSALRVIARVGELKKRGFSMAEIVEMIGDEPLLAEDAAEDFEAETEVATDAETATLEKPANDPGARPGGGSGGGLPGGFEVVQSNLPGAGLRMTLDEISHPAFMVNNCFELEWWNDEANTVLLGDTLSPSAEISERNLFKLFCNAPRLRHAESWDVLLDFHMAIAKNRVSKKSLLGIEEDLPEGEIELLMDAYDAADPITTRMMVRTEINLAPPGAAPLWFNVYASFFREGLFFVFEAFDHEKDNLATFLSRRDVVIRELLRKRRPYLTPLAVLVADLQASTRICAELPPEEYFGLINSIWSAMEPKLRAYHATHGKHVGDGMLYYFLPQPDSNHVYNAIRCALAMTEAMHDVSREWRGRKNWLHDLKLNIGVHEGEEWFGTYQTPTHVEFTALGDSINQAARLSDFAREGSVWVSKSAVGKLSSKERQSLRFGIRRQGDGGQPVVVPSSYSRVSDLVDLENPKNVKFRDIAVLPVTEVFDVVEDGGSRRRSVEDFLGGGTGGWDRGRY